MSTTTGDFTMYSEPSEVPDTTLYVGLGETGDGDERLLVGIGRHQAHLTRDQAVRFTGLTADMLDLLGDSADDETGTHRHDALVVTARAHVDDWLLESNLPRLVWGACTRAGLPAWVWPSKSVEVFAAVQSRYDGWVQAAEGRVMQAFEAGLGDLIDAGDEAAPETEEALRSEVTELIAAVVAG